MKNVLLPRKYGYIGFALLIMTFALFLFPLERTITITIATQFMTAGFLTLVVIRQKEEDEMMTQLRLNALLGSVIFISSTVIIFPIVNWVFNDGYLLSFPTHKMIFSFFAFYFLTFWQLKRNVSKNETE